MDFEIEYEKLSNKEKDKYDIIDIRDESSFLYGHIPGALNIPENEILNKSFSKEKEFFVYCRHGEKSQKVVETLRENGIKAYNLKGGYFEWLKNHIFDNSENKRAEEVEKSIRKKFHKELFSKFCKAINTYELVSPGDKIAVCISGGKDSMLLAKLFQELKRHKKFPFELVFLVMDPGYSKENREIIEMNAQMLNVPITVFETNIFENVFEIEKYPCYVCARMRRGHLYSKAKQLGCNKIALGHHFDDVIETTLMGMLYGAQIQTMMPKIHSTNFEGMELIRPMYLIHEDDIKHWRDYNNLHFIQCACKFTDTCSGDSCSLNNTGSKRKKVKEIIAAIKKDDPQVEGNIFKSMENVNLATVISYKDENNNTHPFLKRYKDGRL